MQSGAKNDRDFRKWLSKNSKKTCSVLQTINLLIG